MSDNRRVYPEDFSQSFVNIVMMLKKDSRFVRCFLDWTDSYSY